MFLGKDSWDAIDHCTSFLLSVQYANFQTSKGLCNILLHSNMIKADALMWDTLQSYLQ